MEVGATWPPGRRRRAAAVAVAAVLGASSLASCVAPPAPCEGFVPGRLPEFVFGSAATDIGTEAMTDAAAIGYRWIRVPIRWQFLQPTVAQVPTLTRAELAADPALVDRFARDADWSIPDRVLAHATALGLDVIGFVGASSPPSLDGTELSPASIGPEAYVASQELVARAIVRRYGPQRVDAPDDVATIGVWQTENELNISPAATIIGWRKPAGLEGFLTSPWARFEFQTDLLAALRRGVRAEDPDAVTIVNVNTDMADGFNTLFGRPGWEDVVSRWRTLADVIGLDTYPNYFRSRPIDGTIVGDRVRRIHERACPGQQVMVVETNAPNGPVVRGWSPEGQAEFLAEAWASSKAAGVDGFMPFGITQGDPVDPEFTVQDQANLDVLGSALRDGDLAALAGLQLFQADWMANRMPELTQAVEGHWGVVRADGSPLPVTGVVRAIAADTAG